MNWELKKFNELTLEEMYKILQLRNEVFIVEQNCLYQDIDDKDQKSYHLFCREEEKIIACVRILEKGLSFDEIAIGRVCVSKDFRGKGIAREIMKKAIRFIEKELCGNSIKIQAQAYLIGFYESLGFKGISEEYLEDDIPHIDMMYLSNK
ncbi:MAG TPA: GNAT family N-acetyltransferase [Clostridium sp.]|nr:GNAT family N-acetyltransferase [Clostridium sp.]